MEGAKVIMSVMASFKPGLGWAAGKGLGAEVWVGPSDRAWGGHCMLRISPSLPSHLQQLSPARLPAELLAPLKYISLVGCSISILASLITILLHIHARYSPALVPACLAHCQWAPLLLSLVS